MNAKYAFLVNIESLKLYGLTFSRYFAKNSQIRHIWSDQIWPFRKTQLCPSFCWIGASCFRITKSAIKFETTELFLPPLPANGVVRVMFSFMCVCVCHTVYSHPGPSPSCTGPQPLNTVLGLPPRHVQTRSNWISPYRDPLDMFIMKSILSTSGQLAFDWNASLYLYWLFFKDWNKRWKNYSLFFIWILILENLEKNRKNWSVVSKE